MSKIYIRVNGESIGTCHSLKINQSEPNYWGRVPNKGTVSRIVFDGLGQCEKFINTVKSNHPMELELESNDCIWKAHRTWAVSYSYSERIDFTITMDEMQFECELLEFIQKSKFNLNPTIVPTVELDTVRQEMINKFTAAISSYYKKDKMNSREEIRKFMGVEQSMVQKAKRYDADVSYLLDQLWRDEHTHAECESQMYSSANVSNILQTELLGNIMKIIIEARPDIFSSMDGIIKCTQSDPYNSHNVVLSKITKLVAEYQSTPVPC